MTDRRSRWLPYIALFAGLLAVAGTILIPKWRTATKNGGQVAAEPFRIAGNFYYVGANDVASFLITSPQGHLLIDGGYPGTPPMIMASIRKLGFDIKDVKILLNSEPHYDHAGGLAELQDSTGAKLYASDASADAMETGGADPADGHFSFYNIFVNTNLAKYDEPRVDHRVKDGEIVTLGPIQLTAHITPGHTRGCTTWTFAVRDGNRTLNVVDRCSLEILGESRLKDPNVRAAFEHTFEVMRQLPVDIWVTSHGRAFGRYRKFVQRDSVADPVAPFIDRDGYMHSLDSAEAHYRAVLAKQEKD